MNRTKQPSKFRRFLRNNAALLLLIFCVLAITAVVLSVTLTRNTSDIIDDPVVNNPNDDLPGNTDPSDKPSNPGTEKVKVYFIAPLNYTKKSMDYTTGTADNPFEYNATLEVWAAHRAVDLLASEGTKVVAMYEGTVLEVGTSAIEGNYVIIDHGDGVIATYASLQNVQVEENQKVAQGEDIGEVSISASAEFMDGAHLHLAVTKNNVIVDPTPYINGEVYREIEK